MASSESLIIIQINSRRKYSPRCVKRRGIFLENFFKFFQKNLKRILLTEKLTFLAIAKKVSFLLNLLRGGLCQL